MTETGQSNHHSQSVTTFLNQLGKNHQEKPERKAVMEGTEEALGTFS